MKERWESHMRRLEAEYERLYQASLTAKPGELIQTSLTPKELSGYHIWKLQRHPDATLKASESK